jgi:transposase
MPETKTVLENCGTGELERLRSENAQLRRIFETATVKFNEMNIRIPCLEEELRLERERNRALELECAAFRSELRREKARAEKFASMLFGLKSEKLKLADIDLKDTVVVEGEEENVRSAEKPEFPGIPEKVKRPRGAVPGHSGNGRKIPEDLPVVEVVLEAPEDELICRKCGGIAPEKEPGLEHISYQVSVRKQYYMKRIVRKVYGASCKCDGRPSIIMAPPAAQIITKGKYSEEIWADILVSKYMGHMPVNRQLFEMVQSGINIKSGMVFNGLKKIYFDFLNPLYEMLLADLRMGGHWHADETRWRMFMDECRKLWYMWAFRSEKIVAFVLDPTRAASVPLKALFGLSVGDAEKMRLGECPVDLDEKDMKKLNVDRYSAYKVLAKYGLALLSYCWAHVRRDFIDIQKKFPGNRDLCAWAEEWVVRIAELYRINNERVKYPKGSEPFLQYDTRLRKALGEMKADSEKKHDDDAQKSATDSMKEHWNGLTLFVEYPELPMDNNLMENGIRPCALGRNNFLGNHSIWGGNLAACMYSLVQTCLLNNINPRDYLLHYFNVCANSRGTMTGDRTRACLPYNLDAATREKMALKKF